MSGKYRLELTTGELDALGFAADRYTPAELLWDGMEEQEEEGVWLVPEHVMWEVTEACRVENGCGEAYPGYAVLGGTLAVKLTALMQEVV